MLKSTFLSEDRDIAKAAANAPALKRGARGEAVRRLQVGLSATGYSLPRSTLAGGGLDGIYGGEVCEIVIDVQRRWGLTVDSGSAGRQVIGALDQRLNDLERALERLLSKLNNKALQPSAGSSAAARVRPGIEDLASGVSPRALETAIGPVGRIALAKAEADRGIERGGTPRVSVARSAGAPRGTGGGAGPAGMAMGMAVILPVAAVALALPAAGAMIALEAALISAIIALLALIVVFQMCKLAAMVIPAVADKVVIMMTEAYEALAEAVKTLAEIVAESLAALGQCGHFLVDLLDTLKKIVMRGQGPIATTVVRTNAKQGRLVANPKVLEGIEQLMDAAVDLVEKLMACLMANDLMTTEAGRRIMDWIRKYRKLKADVGGFEKRLDLW